MVVAFEFSSVRSSLMGRTGDGLASRSHSDDQSLNVTVSRLSEVQTLENSGEFVGTSASELQMLSTVQTPCDRTKLKHSGKG